MLEERQHGYTNKWPYTTPYKRSLAELCVCAQMHFMSDCPCLILFVRSCYYDDEGDCDGDGAAGWCRACGGGGTGALMKMAVMMTSRMRIVLPPKTKVMLPISMAMVAIEIYDNCFW